MNLMELMGNKFRTDARKHVFTQGLVELQNSLPVEVRDGHEHRGF